MNSSKENIIHAKSGITGDKPRAIQHSMATDDLLVERSRLIVPMPYESFAHSFDTKLDDGAFLGRTSPAEKSHQRRQFAQICRVAKSELSKGEVALEPSLQALERTKQAAKDFFFLSYKLLDSSATMFPLAGRNKCLGMVAVPTTTVVTIAISQDKNPVNDESLRNEMVLFLNRLNQTTNDWTFELACIPTKSQYLMPRTISLRAPQAASEASVKPHTRCVEVALMAALCKAGRTKSFTSSDTGIIAFGGTLWASSTGSEAVPHFEGVERNKKYTKQPSLEVILSADMSGWIDVWDPCPEHCKIYKYEMLAIGGAGGFSTSFFEPRSESGMPKWKSKSRSVDNLHSEAKILQDLDCQQTLDKSLVINQEIVSAAPQAESAASLSSLFTTKNHAHETDSVTVKRVRSSSF